MDKTYLWVGIMFVGGLVLIGFASHNIATDYKAKCTELHGQPIYNGERWECLGARQAGG